MKEEFLELLIHNWDNLEQAQGYPTEYAYCHYDWSIEDGVLKSKQWYDHNMQVYRERTHAVEECLHNVILHIDGQNARIIFAKQLDYWVGESEKDARTLSGVKIESRITLSSTEFTSMDRGVDSNGNIVWGKQKGAFIFKHTNK